MISEFVLTSQSAFHTYHMCTASVRAAQARYHAKRKGQMAVDEALLETATAAIKGLEDEKHKLFIGSTINNIQLEIKDEILKILQHPVTIGGNPTLTSNSSTAEASNSPFQCLPQCSLHTQPSTRTTYTTATNTTHPDIPTEYDKIPSQLICEVQTIVVNKLQELKQRHGSLPPSMMSIEAVKKMCLAMYANEWSRLSIETQSLVNKLTSQGGRDGGIEREIEVCLEGHVPFFMMPMRYNPQLIQEFFLNGTLVVPGTDNAERRKFLVNYLGVTPSQVAQFQTCWHQYHNQMTSAQIEQNEAIELIQIVPTSIRTPALDGSEGLEDFSSMQEMMMAYCSLAECTSKLDAWQKKQLLGILQMSLAVDSILQTIQRAKIIALCAPNCPDVLTVTSILGSQT